MTIFRYVNKLLAFRVNQNLIIKFTRTRHWTFPWAIQSKPSLHTRWRHILILFFHLRRSFQNTVWFSSLSNDILLVFFPFPKSNWVTELCRTSQFLQTANIILLWICNKSHSYSDTLRTSKLWRWVVGGTGWLRTRRQRNFPKYWYRTIRQLINGVTTQNRVIRTYRIQSGHCSAVT
jgi:hypothetical protein